MMLKRSLLALLTTAVMTTTFAGEGIGVYDYSDSVDASRTHPGSDSIPLNKVPMFICFGWDDNGVADKANEGGATWIRNYLKDKKNPAGSGQAATYDGSAMRSAFYFTAKYAVKWNYENYPDVRAVWKDLYADGHEVGNHSTEHLMFGEMVDGVWKSENFDGTKYTEDEWYSKEIDSCHNTLTKILEFDASDLYGWRTPRLEWNDTLFKALKNRGFVYDCSIESNPAEDGKSHYWPHTMNNGTPLAKGGSRDSVTSHAGLWQMPAYRFNIPEELQQKAGHSVVTGLDYNVWVREDWGGLALTGPDFTTILNHNLDLRMQGNRCPMLVGLHSDFYTDKHDKNNDFPNSGGAAGRQKAIEDFIEYAVTTYPNEVRIVTGVDIIKWMRDPKPLGETAVVKSATLKKSDISINAVTKKSVNLTLPVKGSYMISLYTVAGKKLLSTSIQSESPTNEVRLSKRALNSGMYMLTVDGEGHSFSEKINIQ